MLEQNHWSKTVAADVFLVRYVRMWYLGLQESSSRPHACTNITNHTRSLVTKYTKLPFA
jgi:hypothetical protein